jgi:hypothetical protein
VEHPRVDPPQPAQQHPPQLHDEPRPPSKDSERRDLDEISDEQLTEEARRSREKVAEASRKADEARRDLEP